MKYECYERSWESPTQESPWLAGAGMGGEWGDDDEK